MKKILFLSKTAFLAILFFIVSSTTILFGQTELSPRGRTLVKVAAGVHFTFKNFANDIWQGYDLSTEPYIMYIPDELVLFLNAPIKPAGFQPYPSDWQDIGATAFVHFGTYGNLMGQFVFDFPIDSLKIFAMGMPNELLFSTPNPPLTLFRATVHEGFHHYQRDHFGDIPWAREEQYPILDTENTALASLEMLILKDALQAMYNRDRKAMEELLKEFVAVRVYRWRQGEPFIRQYEQGQEINEGTAKYVEDKAVDCLLKLKSIQINNHWLMALEEYLQNVTTKNLLLDDIQSRLTGRAVAPDDMLRNRIYPLGASLGFLMDELKIDWKRKFQAAGPDISLPSLLIKYFRLDSTQLTDYLLKAKSNYHYPEIFSSVKNLIDEYYAGYQKALEEFNNLPGTRIEINLSNNGIQRFRSTGDKKWIVENGKKLLCLHYNLYSLKSITANRLQLEIHDKALFDENDWQKKRKKVIFYANHISSLILDDTPIELTKDIEKRFKKMTIEGDNFRLETEIEGKYFFKNKGITINLE